MTPELRAACERAVHVLRTDGQMLRAGRATLFVLSQVGFPTLARVLGWPPFVWAVELGYYIVARNRRFFGKFLFRDQKLLK